MKFAAKGGAILLAACIAIAETPALAQDIAQAAPSRRIGHTVRVVGVVRDEANAIALPGVPVEVVGTSEVAYTDVDGRYALQLPPGKHQLRVTLEGYQEKVINIETTQERLIAADVGLTMTPLTETVTVTAQALDVATSSAEAQLIERKRAPVITDNIGAQEMKQNGDSTLRRRCHESRAHRSSTTNQTSVQTSVH